MPRLILGVTGSVAATLTPKLVAALAEANEVRVVATKPSLYFWRPGEVAAPVFTDETEWPGSAYVRDQEVPHIALGDWADALVVAPLTANTLAKLSLGLADNLLTCLYYAWPVGKPVVVVPAMNTRMWQNPKTAVHLAALGAVVVPPVSKHLACGTEGMGAMADVADIVAAVRRVLGP